MGLRDLIGKFLPGSSASGGDPVAARALEGFDWKFYAGFYPDLKRSGITGRKKATRHWLQFGFPEGRIGGPRHLVFLANWQILQDSLRQIERRVAADNSLAKRPGPLINILTRSNRRPLFFQDNRQSVTTQTYKNFRQLVSYENSATLKYLSRHALPAGDLIRVARQPTAGSHPYNLFVNDLMEQVAAGWILFLDDDDLFTTPHALATIASQLTDEDSLVIWRAWFPDKTVPATKDIQQINPGGITSCCFAFHSKHKAKARWHEFKAGDYRCFEQLRSFLKPVFLDDVLAKVNYLERSAGWGEPLDKRA